MRFVDNRSRALDCDKFVIFKQIAAGKGGGERKSVIVSLCAVKLGIFIYEVYINIHGDMNVNPFSRARARARDGREKWMLCY